MLHSVIEAGGDLSACPLAVSPATMDRMLAEVRLAASNRRRLRSGMTSVISRDVPSRTFNDWADPEPNFVEAKVIAHGGTSVARSFA